MSPSDDRAIPREWPLNPAALVLTRCSAGFRALGQLKVGIGHWQVMVQRSSAFDKPTVQSLHDELEAAGINAWWGDHILPGQDWELEIRQAMKRSNYVLLCLSQDRVQRDRSAVYPELLSAIEMLGR